MKSTSLMEYTSSKWSIYEHLGREKEGEKLRVGFQGRIYIEVLGFSHSEPQKGGDASRYGFNAGWPLRRSESRPQN